MPGDHRLNDEDRARGTEARARRTRYSRAWYMKQLMDISQGTRKCDSTQLAALKTFAAMKGWHGPTSKRNVISKANLEKMLQKTQKPELSPELAERLAQVQ